MIYRDEAKFEFPLFTATIENVVNCLLPPSLTTKAPAEVDNCQDHDSQLNKNELPKTLWIPLKPQNPSDVRCTLIPKLPKQDALSDGKPKL